MCRLADVQKKGSPLFPISNSSPHGTATFRNAGGILETTPTERGFMRSLDRYASAKGKLKTLRACGFNFFSLEPEIAKRLLEHPTEENSFAVLKREAHRDNDFLCSDTATDRVVGATIDTVLDANWCSQEYLPRLAQGLMDNEDAWVLRKTPLPSPAVQEWPTKELNAFATDIDIQKIQDGFRNVATKQALPIGWTVVAAYVYGAHWREDFGLFQWMELTPRDNDIVPARPPTIPSGRTFNWWLGDNFEPKPPNDLPVLAFFTRGSQRLVFATVEIQPAKIWSSLGLRPSEQNLLVWRLHNDDAARYQRFHGNPNTSGRGPHNRQPFADRWIMRTDVVSAIEQQLDGRFRVREAFERRRGDFET